VFDPSVKGLVRVLAIDLVIVYVKSAGVETVDTNAPLTLNYCPVSI
jgi:hypothetical protein